MAQVKLDNVKVSGIFWEGKGLRVEDMITVSGNTFPQLFSVFFNEPHGYNVGDILSMTGELGASPKAFEKADGTTGVAANLTVNKMVLTAEPIKAAQDDPWANQGDQWPATGTPQQQSDPSKTQEAAVMEQWPTATIGQAAKVEDAPF
jgi:hypothetical protein